MVDDSSLKPIVIRLSGHVHTNDRMALREIGRQLLLQNGPSELEISDKEGNSDEDEDEAESNDDVRALARINALLVSASLFLAHLSDCRIFFSLLRLTCHHLSQPCRPCHARQWLSWTHLTFSLPMRGKLCCIVFLTPFKAVVQEKGGKELLSLV